MSFEEEKENISGGSLYRFYKKVMEEKLGRSIRKGEVIHHIDGNRQNNHPDNLMLFPSQKEHRIHHARLLIESRGYSWEEIKKDYHKEWYLLHKEKILKKLEKQVPKGDVKCPNCSRTFVNKKSLSNHRRKHHAKL